MVDFNRAKNSSKVKSDLEAIEDKLRERGFLVKATGDSESDVTISYDEWGENDERGPYVVIAITSSSPKKKLNVDRFEEISDYVNEKLSDVAEQWPQDVANTLADIFGQVVLLNGKKMY